jgi:hypothetical protein
LPTADVREPVVPQRKISETVVDFGAPLIAQLDSHQSLETVRAVFNIVITVWNAHVMAMPVWGQPEVLKQLRALMRISDTPPEMAKAFTDLSARRRKNFRDDPRAVGQWNIQFDPAGRVRLYCEAHVPPSLIPHHR